MAGGNQAAYHWRYLPSFLKNWLTFWDLCEGKQTPTTVSTHLTVRDAFRSVLVGELFVFSQLSPIPNPSSPLKTFTQHFSLPVLHH